DVYVRDLDRGVTTCVSALPDGSPADGDAYMPRMSENGRVVVFTSEARDLLPDATSGTFVFVKDLETGDVHSPFLDLDGDASAGEVFGVSDDGSILGFMTPSDVYRDGTPWTHGAGVVLFEWRTGRVAYTLDFPATLAGMSGDATVVYLSSIKPAMRGGYVWDVERDSLAPLFDA